MSNLCLSNLSLPRRARSGSLNDEGSMLMRLLGQFRRNRSLAWLFVFLLLLLQLCESSRRVNNRLSAHRQTQCQYNFVFGPSAVNSCVADLSPTIGHPSHGYNLCVVKFGFYYYLKDSPTVLRRLYRNSETVRSNGLIRQ